MRALRLFATTLLLPATMLLTAMDAPDRPEPGDVLDGETVAPLGPAALAEQRGGFTLAGLTINLGIEFRTFMNGELVLRTVANWGPSGATREEWSSAEISAATADQIRDGMLSANGITMRVGNENIYLANDARTALVHRTDGGLQNMVVNTASNQAIRQEANITLDVAGYSAFGSDIVKSAQAGSLNDAITTSQIGTLP